VIENEKSDGNTMPPIRNRPGKEIKRDIGRIRNIYFAGIRNGRKPIEAEFEAIGIPIKPGNLVRTALTPLRMSD